MPIVAHNDLPTFQRLRNEGQTILEPGRALHQTIRELHIGVLNMMPDAALAATERQFFRLVGESNPIAQFYMHPFTLAELPRGEQASTHIERYYESFDQIRAGGLDALIITGANVSHPDLSQEPFWEPLRAVFDWAQHNVTSVLLLPGNACGDAVSAWQEAPCIAGQALGCVPAHGDPAGTSTGQ